MSFTTSAKFWIGHNHNEEKMIHRSTGLKTKVELLIDGEPMECGEFDNTKEAGDWMAAKVSYWKQARPLSVRRFRTV